MVSNDHMCRPGKIGAKPSQVSPLAQKDRQRLAFTGKIVRGLNAPSFCTSLQATRAFPLPKLDCGFVQPCMLMFNIQFPGQEEKTLMAGAARAAQDGTCCGSSILTASTAVVLGRQTASRGWHRQRTIALMPALMLSTYHPSRGRYSVIQMLLQCPLEAACKQDAGELHSTQGAYAMFSWWCESQNLVRQVQAAKLWESYSIFLLVV